MLNKCSDQDADLAHDSERALCEASSHWSSSTNLQLNKSQPWVCCMAPPSFECHSSRAHNTRLWIWLLWLSRCIWDSSTSLCLVTVYSYLFLSIFIQRLLILFTLLPIKFHLCCLQILQIKMMLLYTYRLCIKFISHIYICNKRLLIWKRTRYVINLKEDKVSCVYMTWDSLEEERGGEMM